MHPGRSSGVSRSSIKIGTEDISALKRTMEYETIGEYKNSNKRVCIFTNRQEEKFEQ